MSQPVRIGLNFILVGDELGQIKLVQLDSRRAGKFDDSPKKAVKKTDCHRSKGKNNDSNEPFGSKTICGNYYKSHKHRIIRVLDQCLQKEPAASRAITNIRPIEVINESNIDSTEKPNNLFIITNKVGQLFVCDTDAVRKKLQVCIKLQDKLNYQQQDSLNLLHEINEFDNQDDDFEDFNTPAGEKHFRSPMVSPIYYNMNPKVPVCGAQPINQTNVLVVYKNGDIQHVNIGQEVLQSSLKIKRKAIKMLGLGSNSDAKAVHWKIDGSSGLCYFDSESSSAHMNENDPLTEIVLRSPTHKLTSSIKEKLNISNLHHQSPCISANKSNAQERLIPTQVINMVTSRADQYKPNRRICKWNSITSLNLIYRKLALYDLVGSENFELAEKQPDYHLNSFKLNHDRLAVGGYKYAARVYDVTAQKLIYNCRSGSSKSTLNCPDRGEQMMIGDLDWLGGNKTTRRLPNMFATCTGVDSIVEVFDLRSIKPAFHLNLTEETTNQWNPYKNHHPGSIFTSICASGAPYSTAVPSQQLIMGSTNGQLHMIDLRYVAKSSRLLGKLSGFCGGSVRELRFVSESFDASKLVSCAADRFVRVHKISTSYTSVIAQRLASQIFLGTKPTCIQPVCDEILQNYLADTDSLPASASNQSSFSFV